MSCWPPAPTTASIDKASLHSQLVAPHAELHDLYISWALPTQSFFPFIPDLHPCDDKFSICCKDFIDQLSNLPIATSVSARLEE